MTTSIRAQSGRIPGILYGTAWKKADTERLVTLAIQQGFRGIDTACQPKHYDEAGVGAAVAACVSDHLTREELYLQTKFTSIDGQDPARIPYDSRAPLADQVMQSLAASLRNLRTTYLDCLLLHSPMPTFAQTLAVWRVFESFVDAGAVRQLGISNCYHVADLDHLHRAARMKPSIVQNRFYADTGYDAAIRAHCDRNQIVYQSFWTLTANPQLLSQPSIRTPASVHQKTPAQILFRYLTQLGIVPLSGTRSLAHMREDLSIFDFSLSESERDAISAVIDA